MIIDDNYQGNQQMWKFQVCFSSLRSIQISPQLSFWHPWRTWFCASHFSEIGSKVVSRSPIGSHLSISHRPKTGENRWWLCGIAGVCVSVFDGCEWNCEHDKLHLHLLTNWLFKCSEIRPQVRPAPCRASWPQYCKATPERTWFRWISHVLSAETCRDVECRDAQVHRISRVKFLGREIGCLNRLMVSKRYPVLTAYLKDWSKF